MFKKAAAGATGAIVGAMTPVIGVLIAVAIGVSFVGGLVAAISSVTSGDSSSGSATSLAEIALAEYEAGEEDGTYHSNGEKYWKYMGFGGRVAWCASFVSWCANEAGVGELKSAAAADWVGTLVDNHSDMMTRHKNDGSYTPQVGDVAVWRPSGASYDVHGGSMSHVGIVVEVDESAKNFVTVEGNSSNKVRKNGSTSRGHSWSSFSDNSPDYFVSISGLGDTSTVGGDEIAATAVQLATGAQGSSKGSKKVLIGKGKAQYNDSKWCKSYNEAHDKVLKTSKLFASCDRSVITAIRYSGADTTFGSGVHGLDCNALERYLTSEKAASKGWKKVGTYQGGKVSGCELQPGDVLLYAKKKKSGQGNHIRIYVGYDAMKAVYGDAGGKNKLWFYDSSYGKAKYPFLSYSMKSYEKSGNKKTFTVYRLENNANGTVTGSGNFTKYNLTATELSKIASLCQQEQGSAQGAAAEASLMANRYELHGKKYKSLYDYVRNSHWFAKAAYHMDKQNASAAVKAAVRKVLVEGKRTLPKYVDEHDCFSDISSVSTAAVRNRSNYRQFKSIIRNRYGSKYIFYSFPTPKSDPFGYTSEANRKKFGDACYKFSS